MQSANLYYYKSRQEAPLQKKVAVHKKSDLCIYGATSAGVVAAVQAWRLGMSVILVEFGQQIGGMTASGLGATDIGNKAAIGGLAREFYCAVGKRYNMDGTEPQWTFEPHVAQDIYQEWLAETGVEVYLERHLQAVDIALGQIRRIVMEDGSTFTASVFIDASYEGDLMAKAGVSYHVGREANSKYRETRNGIHFGSPNHNFRAWVDPYVVPGKPDSGLLAGVISEPLGYNGAGDHRVQAYNFRICLTDSAAIRLPFAPPQNYDPSRYEILARYINTGVWDALRLHTRIPNAKTDLNNFGAFSTDHIGANHAWPEADYSTRELIFQDHVNYTQGLLYFLGNDDRLPQSVRGEVSRWGLPADEFVRTGGWPHQLYVREARRMVSAVVMSELHCRGLAKVCDSVGLAAYTMDSHNCRRIVVDHHCVNEGNVEEKSGPPFPISYRAIIPKGEECTNLIVPVCLSTTHIAYGSIRMEPVFMVLGQSAAIAAGCALAGDGIVQNVDYVRLRDLLIANRQVLEYRPV